jgi:hypothetical protein
VENRYTKTTIWIYVGVPEGVDEPEVWVWSAKNSGEEYIQLTRRLVRVFFGEGHLCFEIAAIVEGVRVDDDQGEIPLVHVLFIQLLHSA